MVDHECSEAKEVLFIDAIIFVVCAHNEVNKIDSDSNNV